MPWLLEMTVLVSLLMLPAVIYLVWRLNITSKQLFPDKRWVSAIPLIVLPSFFLFPLAGLLDFYITGDIAVLEYPKPTTYWFWFGLVFAFQLAGWVLVVDVIKLASYLSGTYFEVIKRWHPRIVITLALMVFVFMGWKTYRDTTTIITDHITLPVPDLPETMEGFKIVHISDIQGDEYTGREEISAYIRNVNEINPDLIVFTGDLVSYGTDFIKSSAEEFGKAQARYGTFAVVGDHDYWAGTGHVEDALAKEQIPLLQDENHIIKIDSSSSVTITGVTEVYSKNSDPAVVDSLMQSANSSALKIFASHQVKKHLISSAREYNYDVMLAGHTHGGQIRVPFLGMNFSASERETEYISGLYWEENLPIHINNGLGFTLGPIRYNAPPTITVIELVKE